MQKRSLEKRLDSNIQNFLITDAKRVSGGEGFEPTLRREIDLTAYKAGVLS